jgi:hypothetical protein
MTLASMRRHGVRVGLPALRPRACGPMDGWPDDAPVPSFGLRHALAPLRQAWRDGCAQLERTGPAEHRRPPSDDVVAHGRGFACLLAE